MLFQGLLHELSMSMGILVLILQRINLDNFLARMDSWLTCRGRSICMLEQIASKIEVGTEEVISEVPIEV